MAVSSSSILVGLGVALHAAGPPVFCEDTTGCRAQQACVAGVCRAQNDPRVDVLFPIAVDVPKHLDGPLRRWLRIAGFFQVLPRDRNPAGAIFESFRKTTIDFQRWYDAGAWAVIKGRHEGGVLELRLYRVEESDHLPLRADHQAVGGEVTVDGALRRWADELVRGFAGGRSSLDRRIAFSHRMSRRSPKQIRVMQVDGSEERAITSNDSINMLPGWTADGRLAWTSFIENNPDLYLEGRKFSAHRRMNTGAAFHRDGRRAAITLSKDGNAEIYLLDARTGRIERRLTEHAAIDTSPTWSPDGKHLAFVSDRTVGRPRIYRMTSRGRDVVRLPQVGGYNSSPDWSPAGGVIAYSARTGGDSYDIYAIDLVEGTVSRLTEQGSNEEPCYSPNGRYIVFTSTRERPQSLWIMTSDGGSQQRISRGPGIYMTPAWER